MYNTNFFMSHEYTSEYARKYIESTLASPYTIYKNEVIANLCSGYQSVWDLGGNVSGLIRQPGSLSFQLEKRGVAYRSVDLVPAYFSTVFAKSLGVDKSSIFPSLLGVVGNIQELPVASDSLEAVVSADVIEHIPNPNQAISEIKRVLKPGGKAIIVVPSLYKLDAVHAEHVEEKRYSSHENKLTFAEWQRLIEDSGLSIDIEQSRPLGILSGLLYVAWLDERFVPQKASQQEEEIFSEEAALFKKVKNAISALDVEFDELLIANQDLLPTLIDLLRSGNIYGLLDEIKKIITARMGEADLTNFETLLDIIAENNLNQESLVKIQNLANNQGNLFLGNSALFVATNE